MNTTIFTEGKDAILFCDVSGVLLPVVSWFNDKNENVYNGSPWKLLSINRSYNGTYQCIASNACGMDSKTFDIIVQCKLLGKSDLSYSMDKTFYEVVVVTSYLRDEMSSGVRSADS